MEEKSSGLVDRILKQLNHVLSRQGLTEFEVVPVESNTNKSPVLFVETSVGLESWCVKHVYLQCYTELIDNYLTNPKRRLSRPSNLNCQRLTVLLNATLLLNPDITSLWNKRREMLENGFLKWMPELQFVKLVLSRKPKCNDAFAYRRWILRDVLKEGVVHPFQFTDYIILEELSVCNMAAEKCTNNYHCWDHRQWLMVTAWNVRYNVDCTLLYFNEYGFIKQWSSNHVSDYSCFHFRQFIIKQLYDIDDRWIVFEKDMVINLRENFQKILAEHLPHDKSAKANKTFKKTIEGNDLITFILGYCPSSCKCYATFYGTCRKLELLFYEIVQSNDMLKYYKYHETLWYHRRFIVHEILATMYEYLEVERIDGQLVKKTISPTTIERKMKCETCVGRNLEENNIKVEKQDMGWLYNCPLFKVLVKYEKALIKDRRKDLDKYADRHANYLKYVEGLDKYF